MALLGNIDDLASDATASRQGKPLDLGAKRILYVRRAGGHNEAYRYALARVYAEHVAEIEEADETERIALNQKMQRIVDARSLIDRWEGFVGPDGEPAECSEAALLELFDACPDVHEKVRTMAEDGEEYRLQADTKSDS